MRKLLSFIISVVLAICVSAVPANRRPFVVKQSDGTMLTVVLNGDEALHFNTTVDGKYIVRGECGSYFYAEYSKENGFVSTGILAHDACDRSDTEKEFLAEIDFSTMGNELSKVHAARSAKYRKAPVAREVRSSAVPTTGVVRVPVLLVQYNDVKFTFTKENMNNLLNEENYKYSFLDGYVTSHGSARDYFIAQSGGLFQPEFVVTDIITLSRDMAYYGANDVDGDVRPQEMIREAIGLADPGMDFKQFDNDGDGNVEFVFCIYAGYSEANSQGIDSNTIWPHQWDIASNGGKKLVDGVYCNVYACSSELNMNKSYESSYGKYLAGVGTICHEFSHCLGLHDVYDVTNSTSGNWGMDEWDLMDQGNYAGQGYIPVGYNSYQKDVCGWQKLEVLESNGSYSMLPQTQGGVGYKIVNDANPNEYFILENRKREGWDQELAADGMMIIHVDYDASAWEKNEVNAVKGHPRFQLVPADNDLMRYSDESYDEFYESLAKDLWPGPARNTEFTDTSIPAAKVYTGGYLGKPVTDIKYENYVASFKFAGGRIGVPEVEPASDVTSDSFVANWSGVEGVSEYTVELYRLVDATDGAGIVEKVLEEDFMQCSSTNVEIKENLDDYTMLPGWSGNNIYSENGRLRIGSKNNVGSLSTPLLNVSGTVAVTFNVSKYNDNDKSIKLVVSVVDGSGSVIAEKSISAAGKVELECNVDGDFRVLFATGNADVKRAVVDDIIVSTELSYTRELLRSETTTANSCLFDNLEQGKYAYRVMCSDGENESAFSEFAEVIVGSTSIVEVQGTPDGFVKVYSIDGTMVYSGRNGNIPSLPRGMYVIREGYAAKKLFVK